MKRPMQGIFSFEVNKNLRLQMTLNPCYAKNVTTDRPKLPLDQMCGIMQLMMFIH